MLLLLIAGLGACMKESNVKQTTDQTAIPNKVDIVTESGLKNYLSLPPNTSWQDLDAFYKERIEKYHDRPDLSRFKNNAIFYMVRYYSILDDPSTTATERIAYYTQEMASLKDKCHPVVLYDMLMHLQGHWEPSKIAQTAEMGYKNSMSLATLVKNNNSPVYPEISKGMENLKSLYEAKD